MVGNEIAIAMGDALTVDIRMEKDPQNSRIENCERMLKVAAHAIMQMWDDVQAEKARRAKLLQT
ncbi:hypothetical protein [Acetobacter musti]|nr:hypothetical protein [Acetobacter musti]